MTSKIKFLRARALGAIVLFSMVGIFVFLVPLLFGGWSVFGIPPLPKVLSQFRNPSLGACAFILALVLLRNSYRFAFQSLISRIDPDRLVLPVLAVYAVAYLKAAFLDYAGFAVNAIDFSMYDFAMANTLRGRFMEAVNGANHFGIHATPILFLLLPFHALFHSAYFVVFLHPAVLWAGGYALDILARREGLKGWPRLGILFSFLNCVLISQTLGYGFHVEAFYAVFGFSIFIAIHTGRPLWIFGALALFLMVKEDAPFYAIGILAAAAATRRLSYRRAIGFSLVPIAVAIFYLCILIPENSATGTYALVGPAAGFGQTPASALVGALTNARGVLKHFFGAGWWPILIPSFGTLFFSPFFWIAALPFFGIYSLAGSPLMTGLALYYGMPLVPILFMGWIEGWKRDPSRKSAQISLLIAVIGINLFGGGYLVFRKVDLGRWETIAPIRDRVKLDDRNGKNLHPNFCAPGVLIPHLGYPDTLRLLSTECIRSADRIVWFDSAHTPALSTYPLSAEEYSAILKEVRTWPLLAESGEFRISQNPNSHLGSDSSLKNRNQDTSL
jgi:uncharacterized membrane protein